MWQPLVPAGPMVMLAEVASPHAVKGCLGNKVALPSIGLPLCDTGRVSMNPVSGNWTGAVHHGGLNGG